MRPLSAQKVSFLIFDLRCFPLVGGKMLELECPGTTRVTLLSAPGPGMYYRALIYYL